MKLVPKLLVIETGDKSFADILSRINQPKYQLDNTIINRLITAEIGKESNSR